MRNINLFPETFSQNKQLPIRIVTPDFGHLSMETAGKLGFKRRLQYYFFLFVLDGRCQHAVDLDTIEVGKHELLFALPHQIQQYPATTHGSDYYKLGFDEECFSRLPRQFPFLLNPLNQQKISFLPAAAIRLKAIFEILLGLLSTADTDPELILAHLNSLLTEINTAYFAADRKPADNRIEKFIGFKLFVENNLTDHPTIRNIAEELAVSKDSLYHIVKHFSGLSPKEFITNRLILEARRRLYYNERTSVKELAFDLGFNDPDYFSRLFKKVTGKTVAGFFQDLS
ncbi:helix-turn-helix domain-containing protein [Dyadobacter chenwenxiniae]|uniref:Helix-turn-helix domain-containing protein n=1 Tax=Dyadobacter chenwenxiniae TaxID=2906456 RepID=A0A9X1PME6_9BACT|nr:helix-turn-helix domain-containing protein [Dyadobacter chenwenxiniae]MCF0063795.1 helix-turn-helix domain-containing protein [Dyadobacter chenwenxiniae]UON83471.1 helix-turn-helix domain-containing protein [Dyadobacter chenwenxiniae]